MSILKYKYKAHKFINYAFYVVVFIAGYLLGFGAEKIDFNKLVSQFLMIDNAKALEIGIISLSLISSIVLQSESKYLPTLVLVSIDKCPP